MKDDVELLVVKKGHDLLWPPPLEGYRGGPGTVVPRDDPLLNHRGVNQLHKLAGAPRGARVTPHRRSDVATLYASLGYDRVPHEPDEGASGAALASGAGGRPSRAAARPAPQEASGSAMAGGPADDTAAPSKG